MWCLVASFSINTAGARGQGSAAPAAAALAGWEEGHRQGLEEVKAADTAPGAPAALAAAAANGGAGIESSRGTSDSMRHRWWRPGAVRSCST
jgi:hypothetical protein